jgi:hypothetical protein
MTLVGSTRPEHRYLRILEAVTEARRRGMDPDLLFRCVLCSGPTSCLLDLIEGGAVNPGMIASYAADAPRALRPLWHALAAQAAFLRGDEAEASRLLDRADREGGDTAAVKIVVGRIARTMAPTQRECA